MAIPLFRGGSLEYAADRRILLIALGAVAFAIGTVVSTEASNLGGSAPGAPVLFSVLLGLAAHGGTGRGAAIEQLTTDLEEFVAAVSDDRNPDESESARADRIRDADATFELDRDDEVGRLSEAVEELATTVRERERRFAERERELRATNERFQAIIEASPAALIAVDLEGTVELWNPEAERLFGWSAEEIRGEPLPIVPEERDHEVDQFLHRLESREPITGVETERLTKDGSLVDVSLSKAPFRNAEGDIVGVMAALEDISERKEAERKLRERERRLQAHASFTTDLLDAVDDVFYVVDERGEVRRWNETLPAVTGYSDAEIESMTALELFAEDDRSRVIDSIEEVLETGSAQLEIPLVTSDGESVPYEFVGSRLEDLDGNAIVTGIGRDVSERKRRERELERYETIVQALDELVYTLDEEGNFRFLNDAAQSISGFDPEALLGENVASMMLREDLETARNLIRDLLRADEPSRTFEMSLETAAGDVIETENHMALLPADDSEFAGTAGVIRDITDRKNRERDLERTTDLLERVQRMAKVGGWEMDVDTEPLTATWTEELYRLHDLPRDVTPTLETTLECYHPDDRPTVRDRIETAMATETGYELEARLQTAAGDNRWVHAIGEPIYDDGSLSKYRGSVRDISDQKQRELALKSLHEMARELLNAETAPAVADLVVETAVDLLESVSASIYLLDAETNRFEPAASTTDFADRSDGAPSVAVGDGDSVLWNAYVTGSQTVVNDAEIGTRSPLFSGDVPGGLLVPIGDHGVFVLVAPPATIDDESRRLVETLVATTEAAFDRLESEASLRERDAELEAQNRRLRRQVQVTEIIREIDRSLIGTDSRDEIERTVPERLIEADNVAFAWIGDLDASGTTLEPRAWAGTEPEYLDAVSLDLEASSAEPAVRTARSETPTVVENVVDGFQRESWQTSALDVGFQSVVSIPLSFEEYGYGVLSVYADVPDAFTDLERTVFAELGEGIANAINAAKTREALHAETLVELTLRLEGDDDVLSRIAATTGARVTYEGLGTHSGSETVLFFETSGVPPADVHAVLDDLVSITDSRLVTESENDCLFEATVTGDVVASRLVRHGGSPRSIAADGERTEITVDVPTTTDVREFVEMLGDHYAGVKLQSRRHVQRAMHTRQELITSLFEDLTDRQLEVLRTAYLAGFFEWPRESTGEGVAEMLDVTQPTVNRHLRIGQQRLLEQLFENEMISVVDD